MAFALLSRSEDPELWRSEFAHQAQLDFRVWRNLIIVRLHDEDFIRSMTEFAVLHVLILTTYMAQQMERQWKPLRSPLTRSVRAGVLGLGSIGEAIARRQLVNFLAPLDYIVCVLPLTRDTEDIINARTISAMKPGAYFINIGRGKLVVESDLLKALDSGHLSGATLDIFGTEPLQSQSPFWTNPRVTPHEADTEPEGSIPVIVENYGQLLSGRPLLNAMNPDLGY